MGGGQEGKIQLTTFSSELGTDSSWGLASGIQDSTNLSDLFTK